MKIKIDRYGRILIPKDIKEKLGIREDSRLILTGRDNEIIIRVQNEDLDKRVDDLIEFLKNNAPKPFVSEEEEEGKWMTVDYGLKKIGLKEW